MSEKAKTFVSAVVHVAPDGASRLRPFVASLMSELRGLFEAFEVVVVDNCVAFDEELERGLKADMEFTDSLTVVHMSERQDIDQCMEAGVDAAIGDFVYEFETLDYDFSSGLIWDAYKKTEEGYDVVTATIKGNSSSRSAFYKLFNRYSRFEVDLHASMFRLESRRAINRVAHVGGDLLWRHVAFASCGLKNGSVEGPKQARKAKSRDIFFAADCLLLYTDLPRRYCLFMEVASLALTLLSVIFGVFAALGSQPMTVAFAISVALLVAAGSITTIAALYQSNLRTRVLTKKGYLIRETECLKRT